MSVEILVVNDDAIVVKGLRSASESRSIAVDCKARQKAEIREKLTKEHFVAEAINAMSRSIDWASQSGECITYVSGYGDRNSPFRAYSHSTIEMMEKILYNEIIPIFRHRGYKCSVSQHHFASSEEYIKITITW